MPDLVPEHHRRRRTCPFLENSAEKGYCHIVKVDLKLIHGVSSLL